MYMYVDICIFMYMYIACTYSSRLVHNFINMYIHVCTMYRALCTDLHILVHVVRIPDVIYDIIYDFGYDIVEICMISYMISYST
jgi:hypothetical protein